MATYIKSSWRITFDPGGASEMILLDYGDRMQAEPTITQTHSSELVSFARADFPEAFHFGNVGHSVTWDRISDHGDTATAQAYVMAHLMATGALRVADVLFELTDGTTYRMLKCALSDVTPEMGPDFGTASSRVAWSYQLVGGEIQANP